MHFGVFIAFIFDRDFGNLQPTFTYEWNWVKTPAEV